MSWTTGKREGVEPRLIRLLFVHLPSAFPCHRRLKAKAKVRLLFPLLSSQMLTVPLATASLADLWYGA